MNNYQLKYKTETIWTNNHILTLIQLLIIGQINDIQSDISKNIIKDIDTSMEWNLDKLCTSIDENLLIAHLDKIQSKLNLKSNYFSTNEYAHKLYPLIKQNFSKKESSKLLTKLSRNSGKEISKAITKILNLSLGKSMFETVNISSISELTGEWKSTKMEDLPEYGFNFNMTDLSPSYSEIRILINTLNQIDIIIPARDYTNPKINEFNLISGKCDLNDGHLIISKDDWIRKIPIIKFVSEKLELHLFKTNITLKKTTR
ncbi:hypothetical protein [Cellulophaga omnivescoria]|uniref:hypothetical protein n=1 Tax=Cellulophaga omnivescoria TaxID=1888890 RepID=UPI000984099A|nr:hypothetical protein [Cellulophaga omnivescoria]WBU88422.1 hypothetical protein PBN93_11120 [Cellulophaga omnivescoria]WKB80401.1 hypothetical protein QYR09_11630 [Cellulophaga lytica]